MTAEAAPGAYTRKDAHPMRDHLSLADLVTWAQLAGQLDAIRNPAALPGWLATTTRRECGRIVGQSRIRSSEPSTHPAQLCVTSLHRECAHLPRTGRRADIRVSAETPDTHPTLPVPFPEKKNFAARETRS